MLEIKYKINVFNMHLGSELMIALAWKHIYTITVYFYTVIRYFKISYKVPQKNL